MLSLDATVDYFEGLVPGSTPRGYWLTFEKLLKAFEKRRIRPVFAGALALQAHGVVRATADIDILIHPDEEQAARAALGSFLSLQEDFDTLAVFEDARTRTEVDLLIPFDSISLSACTSPQRASVRGHKVSVVRLVDLIAMKVVAAVDSPAIEPKQRLDVDSLLRQAKVPVNDVSKLLLDEAGREYAHYFMGVVRHVKAHPTATPPRRRPPQPKKKAR